MGEALPPHPMGEPADWMGEILPHPDGGFNLPLILGRVLPLKGECPLLLWKRGHRRVKALLVALN